MRIGWLLAVALAAGNPAWQVQESGVKARFRGVSAVNGKVAWASGANGTIVRTADGGATWSQVRIPGTGELDFRDIDAVDERTAYTLSIGPGEASRIYKTSDGGATWTQQFRNSDPKAFFDAMSFWNPRQGIAVSDSVDGQFVLLLTSDGGGHWNRHLVPGALPKEGAFAASGTNIAVWGRRLAWIGLNSGRVLRTADGGRNWTVHETGMEHSETAGIFSIAFRDARHGVAVGGDFKQEAAAGKNAAVTEDGGRTWQLVTGLRGLRSAVTWLPGGAGVLAVGPAGSDISGDGGRTWKPVDGPGFHAFSAAPASRSGWGAGADGRLARLGW